MTEINNKEYTIEDEGEERPITLDDFSDPLLKEKAWYSICNTIGDLQTQIVRNNQEIEYLKDSLKDISIKTVAGKLLMSSKETHVAIFKEDGVLSVYLNGEFVCSNKNDGSAENAGIEEIKIITCEDDNDGKDDGDGGNFSNESESSTGSESEEND